MSTLVLKLLSYVKTKVEILLNFVPSQKIWTLVEIKQFLIKLIWKWLNGFKKKNPFQSWNNELLNSQSNFVLWMPKLFGSHQNNFSLLNFTIWTMIHFCNSENEIGFPKVNWEIWSFGHKAHLSSPFFYF